MSKFRSLALDVDSDEEDNRGGGVIGGGAYGKGNVPLAIGIDEINMSADGESDLENSNEIK